MAVAAGNPEWSGSQASSTVMVISLLSHLLADHLPLGALLLYGGAGAGLVCGVGLFL